MQFELILVLGLKFKYTPKFCPQETICDDFPPKYWPCHTSILLLRRNFSLRNAFGTNRVFSAIWGSIGSKVFGLADAEAYIVNSVSK